MGHNPNMNENHSALWDYIKNHVKKRYQRLNPV
jgi:hypothetical protein